MAGVLRETVMLIVRVYLEIHDVVLTSAISQPTVILPSSYIIVNTWFLCHIDFKHTGHSATIVRGDWYLIESIFYRKRSYVLLRFC